MAYNPLRAAMGLFGRSARAFARAGISTWQAVTATTGAVFRSQGVIQLPPTDAIDAVLGWANSHQAAMDAVAAADAADPVTSAMVTPRYVNNSFDAFNANPTYSMRAEYRIKGDPQVYGVTIHGVNPEGMTVGDLRNLAQVNVVGVATGTGPQAGQQVTLEAVTGIGLIANTTRLEGL